MAQGIQQVATHITNLSTRVATTAMSQPGTVGTVARNAFANPDAAVATGLAGVGTAGGLKTAYDYAVEGDYENAIKAGVGAFATGYMFFAGCKALSTPAPTPKVTVNTTGQNYPSIIDPRTGKPIPAPDAGLVTIPKGQRVEWGRYERGAYIKEWYERGYPAPTGGWEEYDIHHIIPREYGGTNDFWNLVPVLRPDHQTQFNPWWKGY